MRSNLFGSLFFTMFFSSLFISVAFCFFLFAIYPIFERQVWHSESINWLCVGSTPFFSTLCIYE